jgi:hypothetical protein
MADLANTNRQLQGLARVIDASIAPTRFVLLTIAPHSSGAADGSRVNYVSNCDRADIVVALKEIIARFEGQAQVRGTA